MDGYIALIGLGAIGSPLAHLLYQQYGDRFILLASKEIAEELNKQTIYMNGEAFSPRIVIPDDSIEKHIDIVFVCVKNYSLQSACSALRPLIDDKTLILPLQNGVYSYRYFREAFPDNVILEGFAQGPNTRIFENNIVYQNPGEYHLGKHHEDFKEYAQDVFSLLREAGIPCKLDDDIRHSIWKKMMLNVAGNALTALTGLDYRMFKKSDSAQQICRSVMEEYATVAGCEGITISQNDIEDVIRYFVNYSKSKHTSMLEDVLNKRETENEYIAGHIYRLAEKYGVDTPNIFLLYSLMKIKEDVYLGRLD